jgi:hypothetical protein
MTNIEEQTLDDASDRTSQTLAERRTGCAGQCRLDADQLQRAAFVAKSLADGNRLRILLLLRGGLNAEEGVELGLPVREFTHFFLPQIIWRAVQCPDS